MAYTQTYNLLHGFMRVYKALQPFTSNQYLAVVHICTTIKNKYKPKKQKQKMNNVKPILISALGALVVGVILLYAFKRETVVVNEDGTKTVTGTSRVKLFFQK